jgi:hypothetical protein
LDNYNPAFLSIFSRSVIEQIKTGDPAWSDNVPAEVADVIRRRGFFGHRRLAATKENPTGPADVCGLDPRELVATPGLTSISQARA